MTAPEIDLREPLSVYGLDGAAVLRIESGMINANFKVVAGEAAFVLKWYRPGLRESQPERLRLVYGIQEKMRALGVPAPAIVPNRDGDAFTETEAGAFVLMEFVPGRQYGGDVMPVGHAYAMGAQLHHLFEALSTLPDSAPERREVLRTAVEGAERAATLLRLAEARPSRTAVDQRAIALIRHRLRGLEAWRGPIPAPEPHWVHGDYGNHNVIFRTVSSEVAAVIDWDNLFIVSRVHEITRAFRLGFPDGSPAGLEFLRGYIEAARPSAEEVSGYVDYWSYISLLRMWPLDVRYEQPEIYQQRWDVFIRKPSGWWEANRERLRADLVVMTTAAGDT